MQIPERLINFRCYANGSNEQIGMTDVELPSFEAMKETISGAGIAGEIESPVLGHFGSQKVKLKWRTANAQSLILLAPVRNRLDLRGSIQVQDPMLGTLTTQALVVTCIGQTTMYGLGKLEPGKVMGVETDVEVSVIRITLDGVKVLELDKFQSIFRVNGVDYLAGVRADTTGGGV